MGRLHYTQAQALKCHVVALEQALEFDQDRDVALHEIIWYANGGTKPLYPNRKASVTKKLSAPDAKSALRNNIR